MRIGDWIFVALAVPALAAKDTDYYPGYSNPNVENEMYWKDAINVLQDLNQFSSLYIKYHSCVWSAYGNGAVEHGNGCSGDGEGDKWYMGRTQCFRANAAYSLYGILKDGNSKSNSYDSSNCNIHTYINSFFTNNGVESFSEPLGLGADQANSTCESTKEANVDQYHGDTHLEKKYEGYTSVTTGCTADGAFVVDKFQGAFCDGSQYIEEVYNLADFNDALEQKTCVQVYGSSNGNQRELDADFSVAEQIISNSTACSIREYPHDCPDPFGLLRKYTIALEKASEKGTATSADVAMNTLPWISLGFLIVAVTMFGTAYHSHKVATTKPVDDYIAQGPKKQERVPFVQRMSDVSHIVAFRATSSMRNAKERFQKYAEEEELVVTVDDKTDLVEKGYNAPTPTSSSDESARTDQSKNAQVQASAVQEPSLADWCEESETKNSATKTLESEKEDKSISKTKSDDWCVPVETLPKKEDKNCYDRPILQIVSSVTSAPSTTENKIRYHRPILQTVNSSTSAPPKMEDRISYERPILQTVSSATSAPPKMEDKISYDRPILQTVSSATSAQPKTEDPIGYDRPILQTTSSVTTAQNDRYGLSSKSSLKDDGVASQGIKKSVSFKASTENIALVKEESSASESTKNAEPGTSKATTSEATRQQTSGSKSKPTKEATKSSAAKDATKSATKKRTAKTASTKATTKSSASKGSSVKSAVKDTSKSTSATSSSKKSGAYTTLTDDKKSLSSGETKKSSTVTKKKKRPRMARLSKVLFGERKKNPLSS